MAREKSCMQKAGDRFGVVNYFFQFKTSFLTKVKKKTILSVSKMAATVFERETCFLALRSCVQV